MNCMCTNRGRIWYADTVSDSTHASGKYADTIQLDIDNFQLNIFVCSNGHEGTRLLKLWEFEYCRDQDLGVDS